MHRTPHAATTVARALLLATALSAAGCSMFDRAYQPSASYLVSPPPCGPLEGEAFPSIMVNRFSAIPPFNGRAFLYHNSDGTWREDAYAGFISSPSDMVCDAVAHALEESGRCRMVGVEGIAMRFDYSFDGVIESFYADFSQKDAPKAVVRLRGYLLDRRDGGAKLVHQMNGEGAAPIAAAEAGAVADAMSRATGEAIRRMLEQLPRTLPQRGAAAAPDAGGHP